MKRGGHVRSQHDRKCPVCHVNLTRSPECQECFDKHSGPAVALRAKVLLAEAWNGDEDFFDYSNGGLECE